MLVFGTRCLKSGVCCILTAPLCLSDAHAANPLRATPHWTALDPILVDCGGTGVKEKPWITELLFSPGVVLKSPQLL